jgi:hypothetical protein
MALRINAALCASSDPADVDNSFSVNTWPDFVLQYQNTRLGIRTRRNRSVLLGLYISRLAFARLGRLDTTVRANELVVQRAILDILGDRKLGLEHNLPNTRVADFPIILALAQTMYSLPTTEEMMVPSVHEFLGLEREPELRPESDGFNRTAWFYESRAEQSA